MKRAIGPALQLVLGLSLIGALLWRVHHGRSIVEGVVSEGASLTTGVVYGSATDAKITVTVESFDPDSRRFRCSCALPVADAVAACTGLVSRQGDGGRRIGLRQVTARPAGLSALGASLAGGLDRWPWLLVSFVCVCMTVVLCIWRWRILLRSQGIPMAVFRATELYLVGAFFSLLLPGATAGDLVKGLYVAREAPGRRAEAATTVVLDRVFGLIALIAAAATVLAWQWPRLGAERIFRSAALAVGLAAVAMCGLVWLAFSRWSPPAGRFGAILARIRETTRVAFSDRRALVVCLLLSLGNHAALIAGEYAGAVAMGLTLQPGEAIAGFMLVNMVAALPITPGGLGAREAACFVVLGWFGVSGEAALAVSLMLYGWLVLIGLSGALVWAFEHIRGPLDSRAVLA